MKLAQLFSGYPQLKWGESFDKDVGSVSADSRQINAESVFVAVRGKTVDGHSFLPQVCKASALAVVVEDDSLIPKNFSGAILKVGDTRVTLNHLVSRWNGDPAAQLYCVGVTGTNGKTSITHMIEAVFSGFGWKTGVIGTVDHHIGETKWKTNLTTPTAEVFFKRLAEFKALDANAFCMEVSSIALDQRRIEGVPFDAVVFSNLTQDHLDYHHDMETYFQAKQRLFDEVMAGSSKEPRFAIINIDDPYGRRIQVAEQCRTWTYGTRQADFTFKILKQHFSGSRVQVDTPNGMGEFDLQVIGAHNVYNAIAALAVGMGAGISLESCMRALESFKCVSGRLEAIENNKNFHIFVDYAHTSDALEKVLLSLNEVRRSIGGEGRIITVFGCGGDRDQGKRPLMGQVADEHSDIVFITSDNPRSEDPDKIINDIVAGLPQPTASQIFHEVNREKAICRAMSEMRQGDVLLVAGKGHEDYQIIGDRTIHFSDHQIIRAFLEDLP